MSRFLLDTGIASDYVNRRNGIVDRARIEVAKGNIVGIAVPVLAELVAGIEKSQSRDRNMAKLQASLASFKIWPFDYQAAFRYGDIYSQLTNLGRPIGVIDMMIAAVALTLGCTVVSADGDLSSVPGLAVLNWRS